MVAVAAGDPVALERVRATVVLPVDPGRIAVETVQRDVVGLVDRDRAAGRAGVHQVAGDLGLTINGHPLADQRVQVDPMTLAVERELDAVVRQAFGVAAGIHARLTQQRHGAGLEHAGADAAEHVVGGLPLQDHRVDAGAMQQLAEQQAGGASADDRDLGT